MENLINELLDECREKGIDPSDIVIVLPNGTVIISQSVVMQCSNGIVPVEPVGGMESAELTPEYYRMITGGSPSLEIIELDDEAVGVCADCPHLLHCSDPVPLDCKLDD